MAELFVNGCPVELTNDPTEQFTYLGPYPNLNTNTFVVITNTERWYAWI